MSQKPKLVLFDLGNVLVSIHPEAFLQTLDLDTLENRAYYQPFLVDIVRRYERGDDTTEQYLHHLDALFNGSRGSQNLSNAQTKVFSRDELRRAMLSIIGQPIEGMDDLVRRVAAVAEVGLLSNTNPLHYDACLLDLPVLKTIPYHFLSFQLRSLKPQRAVFEKVLERTGFQPGEILFIDDLPENVHAAQELRIRSHLFSTAPELGERLEEIGLIR